MIEIIVKDNSFEAFDYAVKALKKQISKDDFIQELKDRKYYKKPSEVKREKIRKRQYNKSTNEER